MSKLDIINKVLNNSYKDNSGVMKEHSIEVVMDIPIQSRHCIEYSLYKFSEKRYKADHFAKVTGLAKMCDYFLFVEDNNILYIFIIELKNTSKSSALKQLNAGECFVNYIVNSANRIGENINILDCRVRKIKAKKQVKKKTKCKVDFDNEYYCGDYCFRNFDIDYMLSRV